MNELVKTIRYIVKQHAHIAPFLSGRARWIALAGSSAVDETKTADALTRQVYNRMTALASSGDLNAFLDGMASVVQAQLTKAFRAALRDSDLDPNLVNQDGEGFKDELETMILDEYDFVDGLGADVLAGMSPAQMQARADMWGNRYNDAYNQAMFIIAEQYGGRLKWVYGDTEHCDTCAALNGIVAYQWEWEEAGVMPQQPPNAALDCGGWRCQCSLELTDDKRTPNAVNKIRDVRK